MGAGPRDVVYRSHIEIARILGELARDQCVLTADIGDEECLYLTRVLHVDPDEAYIVVAYSNEKAANAALFERESVTFTAFHPQARVEFTASHPTETRLGERAAVRLVFPDVLIELQRRQHPRFPVPADVSLRCVADSTGVVPFEARIADISRGGLGAMSYDAGIHFAPGTVLRRSRVVIPGHEAVDVDLEVRYVKSVALPDGTWVNRAGVRFLSDAKRIDSLLRVFVKDLDDTV